MRKSITAVMALCLLLTGCGRSGNRTQEEAVNIQLSDEQITVDGAAISNEESQRVYAANDIIYYESGRGIVYGEGTQADAHSTEEAAAHTVVHITKPGRYVLSGQLSRGQVAVDLGEDAKEDPDAVVTLVLDGADISCTVAPAVIFYNVYECGDPDVSSPEVDTSRAGANVEIADGTVNHIAGSYVAKIYKPETVELSQDGTKVKEAKKLHKYDGAFYSKMSMNVDGSTGVLNITAANEGLDTEMHLTINGGNIHIVSGNDGINTNEDGVSVTTVNDGLLSIRVDGATGEGDGIDSNGYLVINGGTVIAQACGFSPDAGIDSDMGIHLNGGRVIATGNMLDHISGGTQNYAVFQFADNRQAEEVILKNGAGQIVLQEKLENAFSCLVLSAPDMKEGDYTLWLDGVRQQGTAGAMGFMGGMTPPEGMELPEGVPQMPQGMEPPADMPQRPEGMEPPADGFGGMPEGDKPPQMPEGKDRPDGPGLGNAPSADTKDTFSITKGGSYFQVIG